QERPSLPRRPAAAEGTGEETDPVAPRRARSPHQLMPGRGGESDAATVARTLQAAAVPVARLLEARELLPAAPGFYCWWSRRNAIAGLPHVPHPLDGGLSLLYVGISPARDSSRQTLRSRVLGNHLNGNVGSSTFRFVLAALLIDELDLRPFLRGTKVA